MPDAKALQHEVGTIIAEAMSAYWVTQAKPEQAAQPGDCEFEARTCPEAYLQQELAKARAKQVRALQPLTQHHQSQRTDR